MAIPSVGRIVHYVSFGTPVQPDGSQAHPSVCRAAIITEVSPESKGPDQEIVSLCVLNPSGQFFSTGLVHSEDDHVGGTWHWPERVE